MQKPFTDQIYEKTERYLIARGLSYTPEQIDAIIQALYTLAEVEYELISSETKDN
jgi:hypothetical protein